MLALPLDRIRHVFAHQKTRAQTHRAHANVGDPTTTTTFQPRVDALLLLLGSRQQQRHQTINRVLAVVDAVRCVDDQTLNQRVNRVLHLGGFVFDEDLEEFLTILANALFVHFSALLVEAEHGQQHSQQLAHLDVGFALKRKGEQTGEYRGGVVLKRAAETALVAQQAELRPDELHRHFVQDGECAQKGGEQRHWLHTVL